MRIAIVGAGNGGTKLLNFFLNDENSEVVEIIDKDNNSPGFKVAREHNIICSNDIESISNVDLIVEATGNNFVSEKIFELYGEHTKILSSDLAEIIMRTIDREMENAKKLKKQLNVITDTAKKLESQMKNLNDFANSLNSVSQKLVKSSNEYKKYIDETDATIKAVNKITQQIKILGLNANIEAARAGEHGRGFAIVATEVQKLSDTTAEFANEISKLLESMGDENSKISSEIITLEDITIKQNEVAANLTDVVFTLEEEIKIH